MFGTKVTTEIENREMRVSTTVLKNLELKILIPTDLAPKIFGVQDCRLAYNYNFPQCIKQYVHEARHSRKTEKSQISDTLTI